jgi:hypothetical protein
LGLTNIGNKTKPLKYSEKKKKLFCTNLEQMFNRTTTGLNAQPRACPPRWPDLTLMDFFLWGHIKAMIYTLPLHSEEDVTDRIVQAATIRQ